MATTLQDTHNKTAKAEPKRRNSIRMGVSCLKVNQDPSSEEWAKEWATLKQLYVLQPRETTTIQTRETTLNASTPKQTISTPASQGIFDVEGQVYHKAEKTTIRKLFTKFVSFIRDFYQRKQISKFVH